MIMKTLKHPFLEIESRYGTAYGGNQAWFPHKFLRKSGCGVISAANVLLYKKGKCQVTEAEYIDFAKNLWKYYFPVIPGFGMNGLTLVIGMNRYFLRKQLPYRACWKFSGKKLLGRIDRMLAQDIPVILSVGPNFPQFWGKETLNLYRKTKDRSYVLSTKTNAHFVTVTGREGRWLQISSWGKEFYISIKEYQEYVKKYSNSLVSNILYISE